MYCSCEFCIVAKVQPDYSNNLKEVTSLKSQILQDLFKCMYFFMQTNRVIRLHLVLNVC